MISSSTIVRSAAGRRARWLFVSALGLGVACKSDSSTAPPTPQVPGGLLPVGQQLTTSGTSTMTLQGGSGGADYLLVAYNSSPNGNTFVNGTITAAGLAVAPSASLMAANGPTLMRAEAAGDAGSGQLVPDEEFHRQLAQRAEATVRSRLSTARAWYRSVQQSAPTPTLASAPAPRAGFSAAPSFSSLPTSVAVGDMVTLNVNARRSCDSAVYHGFRVKAVGSKSIVLADTLNPADGFSDADYQRISSRFDNIVYPLDTQNFGDPTDIDQNGRIAILFTRAVNELTPANSGSYVGGFFYARDLFHAQTCAASNEGEMFYMLVPDPNGTINGNVRSTGFVDSLTTGVLAHEFQHLINAGRRIYINTQAQSLEVIWLNEGLSHIAEELLYYAESGKAPRMNLGDADIRVNSPSTYPFWKQDAAADFSRFIHYLQDPSSNSPAAGNDSLATRGATWSFLRYAVDQRSTNEAATWRAFDNAVDTGVKTITVALATDPAPLFRAWALANYLSGSGFTTDPLYSHKSWNFRNIYGNTYRNFSFPLQVSGLADNSPAAVRVRGLSAAYFRLSVAAGKSAQLSFTTSGPSAANLSFIAYRTR